MKRLLLISLCIGSFANARPSKKPKPKPSIDPNAVCILLPDEPATDDAKTMRVGFGLRRNDYFFSGVAEIAQDKGQPQASDDNKVIYSLQSIQRNNTEGVTYFAPDGNGGTNLKMDPELKSGTFKADSSTSAFPTPPPVMTIDGPIRQIVPLKNCLTEDQTSLCILAGAGC